MVESKGDAMNPDRRHERPGTGHRPPAAPEMDTYTVRLPRWPILLRLLGREPLVRTTDRVEALISVLIVVVTLLAAPIAAAIGTEVYDSRRDVYAAQATVTESIPHTRAAVEAVTVALVSWVAFAIAAAVVFTVTRLVCNHIRSTGWQHALDSLVDPSDGHQRPGRASEG
ncbi:MULTISPECIES: hypothetical protein [unclassified Mycobacterium]|uniref:hypothetical protein n=1 Tax=unclassified Mycobacterium TaxID=2642494 RepID=UPI0029C8C0C1|nr:MULTISPECIES: hypothetical protein [unclassified Mycobacterium]